MISNYVLSQFAETDGIQLKLWCCAELHLFLQLWGPSCILTHCSCSLFCVPSSTVLLQPWWGHVLWAGELQATGRLARASVDDSQLWQQQWGWWWWPATSYWDSMFDSLEITGWEQWECRLQGGESFEQVGTLLWSWSGGSHCWSHCCPSSGTSNPSPLLCFTVLVSFGRDNAEQLFVFVILVSFERGIEWAAVPLRKTENLIPKVETDWELATSSGNKLPCWCIGLSKMAAFILTLGCICFEETWVAWLKRSYVHWLDRWLASSSTYDTVHCSLFTVHCSYYSRNDPHDFSTWKNTKGHLLRNKGSLAMNID